MVKSVLMCVMSVCVPVSVLHMCPLSLGHWIKSCFLKFGLAEVYLFAFQSGMKSYLEVFGVSIIKRSSEIVQRGMQTLARRP